MYIPEHFQVQELVPPDTYDSRGDKSIELIDERVLLTLDTLRITFGTCVVNDWVFGGAYSESGLRNPDCAEYSPTSQHTFGRAMDCKFQDVAAHEARQYVIRNKHQFPHITFLEDDVSWFHFDVRNAERIVLWSPETGEAKVV